MSRKSKRNAIIALIAAGVCWLFYAGFLDSREAGYLGRKLFYKGRGTLTGLKQGSHGSGNPHEAATCRENLRSIERAKRRAADERGTASGYVSKEDLLAHLGGRFPVCPSGGGYTIGPLLQLPQCSIGNGGTPLDDKDDHIIIQY